MPAARFHRVLMKTPFPKKGYNTTSGSSTGFIRVLGKETAGLVSERVLIGDF
jgi:hypothetical protein